jgi:preprotein translocase subunit SecE
MSEEQQPATAPAGARSAKRERTGAGQFLREVRAELRKVAWPSRKEVTSYTIVVLIAVILITLFVFALDQAFGQFVFWVFG